MPGKVGFVIWHWKRYLALFPAVRVEGIVALIVYVFREAYEAVRAVIFSLAEAMLVQLNKVKAVLVKEISILARFLRVVFGVISTLTM